MRVSDLGERGRRLRRVARELSPAPAIPPYFVQRPDEREIRAIGWYMRQTRRGPVIFLGHSAAAAEVWLRRRLDEQRDKRAKRKRKRKVAHG
jgi:hypothetical protein